MDVLVEQGLGETWWVGVIIRASEGSERKLGSLGCSHLCCPQPCLWWFCSVGKPCWSCTTCMCPVKEGQCHQAPISTPHRKKGLDTSQEPAQAEPLKVLKKSVEGIEVLPSLKLQQKCRECVGPVNQSPKVGGEKGASGWGEMKKPWEEQLWGGGHTGIRALRGCFYRVLCSGSCHAPAKETERTGLKSVAPILRTLWSGVWGTVCWSSF